MEASQAFLQRGLDLGNASKINEAIASFLEAARLDPQCAEAHYSLGVMYLEQERFPEAINSWKQAVLADQGHIRAHCNLGMALLLCGQLAEGFREIEWRWARRDIVERDLGYLRVLTLAAMRWRYWYPYRSPIHFTCAD